MADDVRFEKIKKLLESPKAKICPSCGKDNVTSMCTCTASITRPRPNGQAIGTRG